MAAGSAEPLLVRNDEATADAVVSPPAARVAALIVTAREDLEIVRQVRGVLAR